MRMLILLATASALLVAGVIAAAPARAEQRLTAASLKVRTWDLDLSSPAGVDHLADRILRRMWAICGHPTRAGLTHVMTGGGGAERDACKAQLRVHPSESEPVRRAFEQAKSRMR